MSVIPLVPSDSTTLISSLLRLSAHHLALEALASQPLKSGTVSLYLSVPVPVLTPSVTVNNYDVDSSLTHLPMDSQLMGLLQLRYEHDSTTIRLRFGYKTLRDAYDSTTIRVRYNILRGVM